METIGIVGALHTSGLLQRRDTLQARDTVHAVIGALNEAGLLRTDSGNEAAPPPNPEPAPPPPLHATGSDVNLYVERLTKHFTPGGPRSDTLVVLHTTDPAGNVEVEYWLDFPPNNAAWLPEIDKIMAIPKMDWIAANVHITDAHSLHLYFGTLTGLHTHRAESQWK
jgi:hypothetical protein